MRAAFCAVIFLSVLLMLSIVVVNNLLSDNKFFISLPFPLWDFFYSSYMGNIPELQTSVVGCTAQHAGDVMLHSILNCVARHHKHFDPAHPTMRLGAVVVQEMIKYRNQYPHKFYDTKFYSDLIAYDPVLPDYKAVVVVRHPIDRILAMKNTYKFESRDRYNDWLFNTNLYKQNSTIGGNTTSFQTYLNSLNNTDAISYSIYIASLYFQKEIADLEKLRSLRHGGMEFIKLEDFTIDPEASLERFREALHLKSGVVSECALPLMNDKADEILQGSRKYGYVGEFECVHYLYFERLLGKEVLNGFGYKDDISDFESNKAAACKHLKLNLNHHSNHPVASTIPPWPPLDEDLFESTFSGYEFKLAKIARMSRQNMHEKVGNKTINSFHEVDKIKAKNHNSSTTSTRLRGDSSRRYLNDIEVMQILDLSRKGNDCANDSAQLLPFDQGPTYHYLSFIEGTKENKELGVLEMFSYAKESRDPIDSPTGWINRFCPEVVKYHRDNRVPYFDYYSSNNAVPLTTNEAAITMTCLLKAIGQVADKAGAKWALFAGTQLGAVLHGGPIPWDDDIDLIVEGLKADVFTKHLESMTFGGKKFFCGEDHPDRKSRRCHISDPVYGTWSFAHMEKVYWPFVDIFFYYTGEELSFEYTRLGNNLRSPSHQNKNIDPRRLAAKVFRNEDLFPFRQTFYGGIMVPTFRYETGSLFYDVNKCFSGFFNHRAAKKHFPAVPSQLNCCLLSKFFPFVRRITSGYDKGVVLEVLMVDNRPIHVSRVDIDTEQAIESFHLSLSSKNAGTRAETRNHYNVSADDHITYIYHTDKY